MRVVVTGASGFVGHHLLPVLRGAGHEVTAVSRAKIPGLDADWAESPELGPDAEWRPLLERSDAVVHLAARAHVPSEVSGGDVEALYRRINADGTRALAQQAAECGIRRLLLMSSCHAVAAASDEIITSDSVPRPVTAYGRSKLTAEEAVREEFAAGWTILRPPLVYGPGNRANFERLLRLVRSGVPLPLAGVRNRRSFLHVGNLAGAILACLDSPEAAGKIYLPSDEADVSTPELIRCIARSQGVEPRLFAVPAAVLSLIADLPGGGALRKLCSSLFVDSEPLRRETGWRPGVGLEQGLAGLGASAP